MFVNDNIETMNAMEVDNFDTIEDKEIIPECGNCKSDKVKNECEKCGKYFCALCEHKVNGEESESVLDFFKSYNFSNYTCKTAHH